FVKVHPGLTRAEYDAAVEAADAASIDLAGHVPEDVGVLRAIEARQATIDHLDGFVQYLLPRQSGSPPAAGFFGLDVADRADPANIPAAAAATAAAGVWIVPTQTLIEHWAAPTPTAAELAARPEMRYVPPAMRAQWLRA